MINTPEELHSALERYKRHQRYLDSVKNEFDKKGVVLKIPRFFEIQLQTLVRKFSLIDQDMYVCIINTNEIIRIFDTICDGIKEIDLKLTDNLNDYQNENKYGRPIKFYLSGPENVGKTLGMMANAARLKVMENVRVLYIHDVAKLIFSNNEPDEIFQKELFAAFCFDKDAELRDQIANSSPDDWPKLVRNHIITNRLVLVSIWDNVSECYHVFRGSFIYACSFPRPPAHKHVNGLSECSNEIVICLARFNNIPTMTLFKNPKFWTQLKMEPFDEDELIKFIESLEPFGNLFQQLSEDDRVALLIDIEHSAGHLPLECYINNSINEYIKSPDSQNKSPMNVIRRSLKNYITNETRYFSDRHYFNFQQTTQNKIKLKCFLKYLLCMLTRVPLLKIDVNNDCLDKNLIMLVDTIVPGLKGDYCMVEPINDIAKNMLVNFYSIEDNIKNIEENLRILHIGLKSASVFGTMIGFVLSKYIRHMSYRCPLFSGIFIDYKVRHIFVEKPVALDFPLDVYANCEVDIIRPSSGKCLTFDFIAYIKPNSNKNKGLKFYQVIVNKDPWPQIYTSVGKFIDNLKAFQKIFSFTREEIFENIIFVWMVDKNEESNNQMDFYRQQYLKLKEEGKVDKLLQDYYSNVCVNTLELHDQYICVVFQFSNEFCYFEDLGEMFDSQLLREYKKLRDLCKVGTE